LDPADIVQQVFLRAATVLQSEAGYGTLSISAWLRKILANELVDVYRHYHRDKRDIGRELSIDADLQASASGMMGWRAADQTSPSAHLMAGCCLGQSEKCVRFWDVATGGPLTSHLKGDHQYGFGSARAGCSPAAI